MSEQFKISSIRYKTAQSREIGSDEPPQRVGVNSAYIECACGNAWTASPRLGIAGVLGGALVTCPSCGASERVSARQLGI